MFLAFGISGVADMLIFDFLLRRFQARFPSIIRGLAAGRRLRPQHLRGHQAERRTPALPGHDVRRPHRRRRSRAAEHLVEPLRRPVAADGAQRGAGRLGPGRHAHRACPADPLALDDPGQQGRGSRHPAELDAPQPGRRELLEAHAGAPPEARADLPLPAPAEPGARDPARGSARDAGHPERAGAGLLPAIVRRQRHHLQPALLDRRLRARRPDRW